MKSFFRCLVAAALATGGLGARAEASQTCMLTYFKTKSATCIDEILSLTDRLSPRDLTPSVPPIGFLAEIFLRSPSDKARIMNEPREGSTKEVILAALFRAGLAEDVEAFTAAHRLESQLQRLRSARLPTLKQIAKPESAADVDFLTGAYGAFGNRRYAEAILSSFADADETTVRVAIRMGLLTQKWGATFAPRGHTTRILRNFCERYGCPTTTPDGSRVLTLMAAYWSVGSVALDDAGTKKIFDEHFEKNKKLKAVLLTEQAYFANYVMALSISRVLEAGDAAADKTELREKASRSIETFESFGSLPEALPPPTSAKDRM